MPLSDHAPRLEFLRSSASSLEAASPSTAAYLMSVHNSIIRDEFKPLNQRQQEAACGACGSLRNAKSTRTIQVAKRKKKPAGLSGEGATVMICLRCHRRTIKPSKKETLRSVAPPAAAPVTATLNSAEAQSSTSTTPLSQQSTPAPKDQGKGVKSAENASSKKRAKSRKQGGLQALMASKQQSRSTSSSLDLFDFLQQ
ncbi:ribonuclease P Rpr2/Rpp21/SNM1 subunit [Aspergillus homomorphus CBS 101889]|uniref:Cullin binding protein CanA n=1 Tax=Aspergillus homomorphus (strain CBS 101889) TaxID=1450537 RepID=A0A395HZV1_ASPHC|nr:hypothetical protein BO97DRAFT_49297 [Aspergillus homomorphus CBS 101889]RAL12959.1 hypothetical protein BO97DRAFT_49297 [Aspergillus homomorphus CBS 101889]